MRTGGNDHHGAQPQGEHAHLEDVGDNGEEERRLHGVYGSERNKIQISKLTKNQNLIIRINTHRLASSMTAMASLMRRQRQSITSELMTSVTPSTPEATSQVVGLLR